MLREVLYLQPIKYSTLLLPCLMYMITTLFDVHYFCFVFTFCLVSPHDINISVQYDGGLLPDIILLTQCYYHR